MKSVRILTTATLLVSGASLLLQLAHAAGPQSSRDYETGIAAYKRRDFKTAAQSLEKSFSEGNSTPLVLLYIGHSYFGAGDKEKALKAYSKITYVYPRSPEAKAAAQSMARLDPTRSFGTTSGATGANAAAALHLPPTKPGSDAGRWLPESMPLRVCVTSGLEIPADLIDDSRSSALAAALKDSGFLRRLSTNSNYAAEDRAAVLDGLGMWGTQSLVKFTHTSSSTDADIIVFYADTIAGGPTGICEVPGGINEPSVITISMGDKPKYKKDDWFKSRKAVAAHEFGHAFGLEHSTGEDDIMYPTETHNAHDWGDFLYQQLTSSDRTALFKLYSEPPGYWMGRPSPKKTTR